MKVLVFHIARERYALPLASVDRVLPVARLKAVPGAPDYVRGLLDLHGEPVPVIDLSHLAGAPPDAVRYDTRILLVQVPALGRVRRLGLKAEHVTGVASIVDGVVDAGVNGAAWLGPVAPGTDGMLRLLAPERILSADVAALLFGETP